MTAQARAEHRKFLSTLSLRRATSKLPALPRFAIFLSTLSLRRATIISVRHRHARRPFLSTLSLRRATTNRRPIFLCAKFLSTLSLRRATTSRWNVKRDALKFLSTLSLRRATVGVEIDNTDYWTFLSTLSLRRATQSGNPSWIPFQHFYPRSPCGERHRSADFVGADRDISIHALLAESDPQYSRFRTRHTNFYPRSPCGERLEAYALYDDVNAFLSTLSLRRATIEHLYWQ